MSAGDELSHVLVVQQPVLHGCKECVLVFDLIQSKIGAEDKLSVLILEHGLLEAVYAQ